jgi:pimeloyl-ACP methyl ester carboxylesterase
VYLVTHDRPGYGRSDRRPGRRVVDVVDDVLALADELGFERFAVTGGSGGGPRALACAALLPDRVVRATCNVGVAPFGTPGLERDEWLAGMDHENAKYLDTILAGEEAITPELETLHEEMKERVAVDPSTMLDNFELSESDKAGMARPEMMEMIRDSTFEHGINGVAGWVDDNLAIVRPWGFNLSGIVVPVLIRYGLTDVLVPPAHGEWLAANVPGCLVKTDDVAGHLSGDPEVEIAENFRWLSAGIAPDGARPALQVG